MNKINEHFVGFWRLYIYFRPFQTPPPFLYITDQHILSRHAFALNETKFLDLIQLNRTLKKKCTLFEWQCIQHESTNWGHYILRLQLETGPLFYVVIIVEIQLLFVIYTTFVIYNFCSLFLVFYFLILGLFLIYGGKKSYFHPEREIHVEINLS